MVVPSTIFSVFGLIFLAIIGYFSLAPFIFIIGIFFVGFYSKDMKYGAFTGFLTAFGTIIILGIIFTSEDRLISYGFMGAGMLLSVIDIIRKTNINKYKEV